MIPRTSSGTSIQLRGARLHNLRGIDVDIPHGVLAVVCGVSGSGKTSLALDTLYAEGQRRFLESLSSYARQFLNRIEKPDYDTLQQLPPTAAFHRPIVSSSSKMTVGSYTELEDYLRLLMAKIGQLYCTSCSQRVIAATPQSVANQIAEMPNGTKLMICFPLHWESRADLSSQLGELQSNGFVRIIVAHRSFHLAEDDRQSLSQTIEDQGDGWVVVDRIQSGPSNTRTVESLESAFQQSPLRIALLIASPSTTGSQEGKAESEELCSVDGREFRVAWFGRDRRCSRCNMDYPLAEPKLFSRFDSLGSCQTCHGTGIDSEAKKFATRSRGDEQPCAACQGTGLRSESLAYRIGGLPIHKLTGLPIQKLNTFLDALSLDPTEVALGGILLGAMRSKMAYLIEIGLGHLTLDRLANTLSTGELQRVALTIAIGSSLTQMLYVLEEPTASVHPEESKVLIEAMEKLRDRGNTVLAITHDRQLLQRADWVIEMGPGAGEKGGHLLFSGEQSSWRTQSTMTADYVLQRRGPLQSPSQRRQPTGSLRLTGARFNNLKNLDVEFPLGVLCVVTGVSGSGKSSLIEKTLFEALRSSNNSEPKGIDSFGSIRGQEAIGDVQLIDASPLNRSVRSIPATYMKILDDIRKVFQETVDARTRGLTLANFSFNHAEGRCEACQGLGFQEVDMQFLADIAMDCPECGGTRFRRDVLQVQYRDRNIAEVLGMTAEEAVPFFRGHKKLQDRLQVMVDIGLGYLRLGQPGDQLSQGESQRLKLASYIGAHSKKKTLFLFDEPSCGLHFNDVVRLIDCFDAWIERGHSMILVDHHEQLLMAADHVIELGPGAADEGGNVVASGTPEQLMDQAKSKTGAYLKSLIL